MTAESLLTLFSLPNTNVTQRRNSIQYERIGLRTRAELRQIDVYEHFLEKLAPDGAHLQQIHSLVFIPALLSRFSPGTVSHCPRL